MSTSRDTGVTSEAPKARRTSLTRERIVRVALEIVDRDGLSALSMRRLGAELGVNPMTAYYYIPNKNALLDAIVEAVMTEMDPSGDDPSASLEDRMVSEARAYRDVMLAHLNALPIILTRPPRTPGAMRRVERLVAGLCDGGLPHDQAVAGTIALTATVRGIVGYAAHDPTVARPGDPAAVDEKFASKESRHLHESVLGWPDPLGTDFEFGIRALTRGLLASVPEA
jgi:TetR/AcrR family tetracycline transcriptional repressor